MNDNFLDGLRKTVNVITTENGAEAYESTNSHVLDLFSSVGALRSRTTDEVELKLIKSLNEDVLLTMKTVFYARDVRGGLGEKSTCKIMLKYLANNYPHLIEQNLDCIAEYGSYADLVELLKTRTADVVVEYIRNQLRTDLQRMSHGEKISLLAKWLPSENTSSIETRKLARVLISKLGATPKEYRKLLAQLRKYLKVTEVAMSANKWDAISYNEVPSKAMRNYRKAFSIHDEEGFAKFMTDVETGATKINASTLMPYEIFEQLDLCGDTNSYFKFYNKDSVLEAQWKALPNYVKEDTNVMIMADTSGSMTGAPLNMALSLAVYFAERNTGAYANKFMTFSSKPSFVELVGNNLQEKIRGIKAIVSNTNLEAALDLILSVAVTRNLSASELPKALVIISDMEFDAADKSGMTFYESMREKFSEHGYSLPNIIFWNVDSRQNLTHVLSDTKGVQLVSGGNPSVFKHVLSIVDKTPYEAMLQILNDKRYSAITV